MCMFDDKELSKLPQSFGYKVFEVEGKCLRFEYQTLNGTTLVPRRKWLTATVGTPGFHVFATKAGARDWADITPPRSRNLDGYQIVRVKIRGALYVGHNGEHKGFRVKEIYVP